LWLFLFVSLIADLGFAACSFLGLLVLARGWLPEPTLCFVVPFLRCFFHVFKPSVFGTPLSPPTFFPAIHFLQAGPIGGRNWPWHLFPPPFFFFDKCSFFFFALSVGFLIFCRYFFPSRRGGRYTASATEKRLPFFFPFI